MITRNLFVIAAALCAAGGSAHADSIPGTVTLPGYTVYQQNDGGFSRVSGTLLDTGPYGLATLSDNLGVDPSVSLQTNYEPFVSEGICCTGGGVAQSQLSYSVEYVVPCSTLGCTPSTAPVATQVTASASMTSAEAVNPYGYVGFPEVQTYLNISCAGAGCFADTFAQNGYVLGETSCLQNTSTTGCFIFGVANLGALPQGISTQNITLNENTAYLVTIGVGAENIGPATAEVDPIFTVPGGTGSFVFSSGIESVSSAPEPASWATMLIGLALLVGSSAFGMLDLRRRANVPGTDRAFQEPAQRW